MEKDRDLRNQNRQKDPEMEILKERKYLKRPKFETESGDWLRFNFLNTPTDFMVGASL